MSKKNMILLVIVLVALAFMFMKRVQAPEQEDVETAMPLPTEGTPGEDTIVTPEDDGTMAPQTATVTYGPNGFEPKIVTISAGGTVTFVNESESGMWVASAKHPTHTDYPEKAPPDCLGSAFDQCEAVGAGDFFSFKFNLKGSWGYHNHMSPSNWGTVVVE